MKIINNEGIDLTIEKNGLFIGFPNNKESVIKIFSGEDEKFSVALREGQFIVASIKDDHFDTVVAFSKSELLELLDYFDAN